MKNKNIVLSTLVFLALAFVGATIFYQKSVDAKIAKIATGKGAPFIQEHSPAFGENKNDVLIVEFMDPECESCKVFHPIVKKVFNEYKSETKLVYRYLANHRNSIFGIKVLEAAKKQNRYKETLDVVFAYQEKWSINPKVLFDFLPEAGLDMEKFNADFSSIEISDIISLDKKDANTLGVTGTPTIFVNGKLLRVLSYKTLLDLVESEIYK